MTGPTITPSQAAALTPEVREGLRVEAQGAIDAFATYEADKTDNNLTRSDAWDRSLGERCRPVILPLLAALEEAEAREHRVCAGCGTSRSMADLKAKSLGEKFFDARKAAKMTHMPSWQSLMDHERSEHEKAGLAMCASLSHDETATATIQALTARAEKAEQALSALQQEDERLREVLQLTAALAQVAVSRKTYPGDVVVFTGEWLHLGAVRVSEILDRANNALQAPHSQGGEANG